MPYSDRIVTLEEHFLIPSLIYDNEALAERLKWQSPEMVGKLGDLGEGRIKDLDENGITVQVVSASMPGADLLDGADGIAFAQATNDMLAGAVKRHPRRLAGFAHLPMREPNAAADELERAVTRLGFRGVMINGTTEGRFLDDERFSPILDRAASLDVPIYIHPNHVPKPVFDAYFGGLPGNLGMILATGAFGWHAEVGIHVFRLAFAGTFEKHPGLTVIVGHMGEMLPFMLERADSCVRLAGGSTPISTIIHDHVHITTAGVFSTSAFLNALTTFGADRIMFSVDYPYSTNADGRAWADTLPLSPADRKKIMHENADRLLKLGDMV